MLYKFEHHEGKMTREKLLTVLDIAKELNTGKATIKFLLKRFKNWIPSDLIDGQPYYSNETIKILFFIQEKIELGVLPSKIETQLDTFKSENLNDLENTIKDVSQNKDITIGNDGLELIKTLFSDFGAQQERIAKAHEKRAQVEERKAVAIEKRAVAEEKKADAMNNIADALQEMNQHRLIDSNVQQIAHETASMIASDESNLESAEQDDKQIETDDLSILIQDSDLSQDSDEFDTDLSSLLDEDNMLEEFTADDDLSTMLDQELDDPLNEPDSNLDEDLKIDEDVSSELDDLSLLLNNNDSDDEDPIDDAIFEQLNDLSQLLDTPMDEDEPPGLDDLGALIEPSVELDDLSKLIDVSNDTPSDNSTDNSTDLDDLSTLIDNSSNTDKVEADLDDLSLLIGQSVQIDDLAKLIDEPKIVEKPKDMPTIKIDISPKDDLKKYKAAVMQIIIGFKSEGLSAEEATSHLNENKIETLSGKPDWTSKAISQIYKFIDSAK
jgi:hypothetical protein